MRRYKSALIACILVVFSCLGLARFAFGMILPNMQADLSMNATEAGWLGSANFLGYLMGLFFSGKFYNHFGASILVRRSLLTQAITMIVMAISNSYLLASFTFFFTGFFGALANIAIMTYITQIVPQEIKGKATGIVITGIGTAIIFSGFLVPLLDFFYAEISWRYAWVSFATLIFIITLTIKRGLSFPLHVNTISSNNQHKIFDTLLNKNFLKIAIIYLLFGTTYVVYMTFFVLAVEVQWRASSEISGSFWALLGFASIFAGPLFGSIADKLGNYKALSIVFLVQIIAHGILSFSLPVNFLWFSAFLFGISAWGIPTIMTVLSSEIFGSHNTAKILSLVTLFFALGQIIGPIGAGIMIDTFGNFSYAFSITVLLTIVGFILSILFDLQHNKLKKTN